MPVRGARKSITPFHFWRIIISVNGSAPLPLEALIYGYFGALSAGGGSKKLIH